MREQESPVDRCSGRDVRNIRVRRDSCGDRPVAASGRIAAACGTALSCRQVRIGPADRLEPGRAHLVALTHGADEHAEVAEGRVGQNRPAISPFVGVAELGGLQRINDVRSGIVEGPGSTHVDRARSAAFEQRGGRRFDDRQFGEQLGREQIEVDLAVGVLRVSASGRSDRDRRIVQRHPGEIRAEPADGNLQAFAGDLARDRDTRNAVERFGDVGVGELADVLGEDRIDEADRPLLRVGRAPEARPITGDDDVAARIGRARRPRLRRSCRFLLLVRGDRSLRGLPRLRNRRRRLSYRCGCPGERGNRRCGK